MFLEPCHGDMAFVMSLIALGSYFLTRCVTTTEKTHSILSIILLCVLAVKLRHYLNPLQHLPKAQESAASVFPCLVLIARTNLAHMQAKSQTKRWASFFNEPRAPEVSKLLINARNKGLVRYSGILGGDRVLVTDPEGLHEVLQEKSYSMQKWETTKRILGPILGGGILTAEGELHKVIQQGTLC